MNLIPPESCLVSSCLVGLCTRYDGAIKPNKKCLEFLKNTHWIPVCPEQLGGLSTPRTKSKLIKGTGAEVLLGRAKVQMENGHDVSENFIHGAKEVLKLAEMQNISTVVLKSGSPSCAVHGVIGVTAALLKQHGFRLIEF